MKEIRLSYQGIKIESDLIHIQTVHDIAECQKKGMSCANRKQECFDNLDVFCDTCDNYKKKGEGQ